MKIRTSIVCLLIVAALPVYGAGKTVKSSLFFNSPNMITARISPAGEKIVAIKLEEKSYTVVLLNSLGKEQKILFNARGYGENEIVIRDLQWIDNRYIAVQLAEVKEGIEDLLDTRISSRLLLIDTTKDIPDEQRYLSVRTTGRLVHPMPEVEGHFLYAKGGAYSKIYNLSVNGLTPDRKQLGKLDRIDGGQFTKTNEVRSVGGYALRWFLNSKGDVKAVLNINREKKIELIEFGEKGEGKTLSSWDFVNKDKDEGSAKHLIPIALADERHSYFCVDIEEEERKSLYRVNFDTGVRELVYETSAYKIIDILQDEKNTLVGVKVLRNSYVDYEYIDHEADSEDKSKGELFSIYDANLAGTRFIAYREAHNIPGRFLLLDEQLKKPQIIGYVYPQLANKFESVLHEGSVSVEDLKIPFFVNLPSGAKQPAPLVVMPHGGPIGVFDTPYFDLITQYLVENGFAVLRVNFRGSGGISQEFEDAGKRQWGELMLEDIYQATASVAARSDIDQERVCVAGMSYGGYAATMLLINHPELYQCGVNISGVSDVNLYVNSPQLSEEQQAWMAEAVGDPETEVERLNSISPVFNASRLRRPLLIAHGEKDRTVNVEHAFRLKLMLDKFEKNHTWYLDESSGHHFKDDVRRQALFDKVIGFLHRHISPR